MADESKEIERIYVVPLRKVKRGKSSNAAPKAVKTVRGFLTRHMKVKEEDIWIDDSLNKALWSKGKYKIPSKIRVRAVKFEDGVVEASLPELGFKKSRRELLKEEREKKEPILRREEVEEEGEVTGAEDYEIAPAADGEVKIKKKKAPKKEKSEKEEKKPAGKKKTEKTKEKSKRKASTAKKKAAAKPKKTEKTKSKTKKKPASKKTKSG